MIESFLDLRKGLGFIWRLYCDQYRLWLDSVECIDEKCRGVLKLLGPFAYSELGAGGVRLQALCRLAQKNSVRNYFCS